MRANFGFKGNRLTGHLGSARLEQRIRRTEYALCVLAATALSFSGIYSTMSAFFFILAAVGLIALRPIDNARVLLVFALLLALPLLAIASTVWSDAPSRTLRAGMQLFITFAAAIILAKRCPPELLIGTLMVSVMVIGIQIMPYVPDTLANGYPLRGPLGSKNALGFTAQLGVLLSFATLLNPEMPRPLRIAALIFLPYFFWLINLSQSAGSLTSTAIFLFVFFSSLALGRFPMTVRWTATVIMLVVIAVLYPYLADLSESLAGAGTQALGKDTTLTGRTMLWRVAEDFASRRPMLGYGYGSFWRQGYVEAEALWRAFGIRSRMGFNFHNEYIEMRVGLGVVGMGLLIATNVGIFLLSIYRQLTTPSVTIAFFLALQTAFYARTFAEDGLVAPFSETTVLWIASAAYCAMWSPQARTSIAAAAQRMKLPREALRRVRDARMPRRT
ncbi:MAG: O-antigen ligase family protein [Novosphingobium sp.]